jgi:hypothetical protein
VASTVPVGIGMPTRNGATFIAQALESLLAQDHGGFEIVVSDNASTDGTTDIVRDFARRDSRVRLERVEETLSAAQNFDRVFGLTRGPYFMWAADDDLWDASYVRRCVAALDANPPLVMASTGVRFIDPEGAIAEAGDPRYDNPDLSSRSVVKRVRTLLGRRGWYQVYGLARREALERTHLFQDTYGPDVVLVLELAMLGPIGLVPEPLFFYRRHPGRTEQDRAARQGGIRDEADVLSARMTHLQEALSEAVHGSALPRTMKLRLRAEIIRAAYLDDTPMRSRTRREAAVRAAAAARDRDLAGLAKYSLVRAVNVLDGLPEAGRRRASDAKRFAGRLRRRIR